MTGDSPLGGDGCHVANALFPAYQQKVITTLYVNPHRQFTISEVAQNCQCSSSAASKVLRDLVTAQIAIAPSHDGMCLYQANQDSPIFDELVSLVHKVFGAPALLKSTLKPYCDRIQLAIIHGPCSMPSLAEHDLGTGISLLVVSDTLERDELFRILEPAERSLGRQVILTLFARNDYDMGLTHGDNFLSRVMAGDYKILYQLL